MSGKLQAASCASYFILLLAACSLQPVSAHASGYQVADAQEAYDELGRPVMRQGRKAGKKIDEWTGETQDGLGLGDATAESFMCSDPGFFVLRQEAQLRDATSWILKGTLHVPAAGYSYRFQFLGRRGPEFFTQLQVGQAVTSQYRQQPAQGPLQVAQKFNLPKGVGLLHVRLLGVSASAQEITCDITGVKEPQQAPPR